jgi:hypothetical protein
VPIQDNSRVYVSITPLNTALTVAYNVAGMIFSTDASASPDAIALKNQAHLGLVSLALNTIAGGAASVSWFLARDSAGAYPITPVQTDTIVGIVAANGSVSRTLGIDYSKNALALASELYLFAKLDVGTANGNGTLYWKSYTTEVVE